MNNQIKQSVRIKHGRTYWIFLLAALLAGTLGIFVINKKIKIAPAFAGKYEVKGIDVSHYQGTIDWPKLADQNLDFAFIKATEGSGHVDECFYDNWRAAGKTDLAIGAYHFFSFDSEGKKQAQFYIDTVGSLNGKLAPAVDVEFYGDKEKNPPPKEEIVKQLQEMLTALEEHYQVKPVIYTTYKAYHRYIKDDFGAYPLWIRNVYYQPFLTAGNTWTFWQYTDTAVLEGYQGSEKYIDMNVFRGTREELQELTVPGEEEKTLAEAEEETSVTVEREASVEAKRAELTVPESFLLWDEEAGAKTRILLEHCNLVYDTEQVRVYSYLGRISAIYILTPEKEAVYPVRNFWMDQDREVLWLLEEKDAIQIRKIELGQEHFPEASMVLDRDGFEALIADTYGILRQADQAAFGNLYADLSCRKEEGEPFLGGRVLGVHKETNQTFEIMYEIDRETGAVSARGYLQDLAIAPMFQEFLFHNLTVQNPVEKDAELGESLSLFDDEIYLSETGPLCKQFAVVEGSGNEGQELLFRMQKTGGEKEWIYVLAEENGELICRDILRADTIDDLKADTVDDLKDKNGTPDDYDSMEGIRWLDCASFLEIPTENCGTYQSREEVFAAVEDRDFSVVVRKPFDPDILVEELEMAYESDGDSSRMVRSDIDGDGFEELVFLIKYDFEEYERIDFIIDYRNGGAVCTYLDWCDGNEWLMLGKAGKLVHCSYSNNSWCIYYGLYECALNARDIKALDYIGDGVEACNVYQYGESGLWWWEGQQPEITQTGIYYTRAHKENTADGTGGRIIKELIPREEFLEGFTELTGGEQAWSKLLFNS